MNRETFLERLRESRLLTAEQLRLAADRSVGESSALGCAQVLAAEGLLTSFQARMLLEDAPGRLVLGQYRLLDELGRGGMGQVFKACHTVMGRIVALKVLWPTPKEHDLAQGWFEREVRTLTQLQHPNIVLAYDANEVDGVRFLVMEYVEGQNLHSLVRESGPLPIPLACDMMAEAATALQYAHEKGLVHRDVKPANLLVPADVFADGPAAPDEDVEARPRTPRIKIVDFGLARLRTPAMADTIVLQSPVHFAGTPDYVSPEQCRDVHAVDIRSDLYSLGCTFFFALTGRPPFGGKSVMEKLANHIMEPPPPVTRLRPDAAGGVAAIVLRLMAKDPDQRFQTPIALVRALRPFCSASLAGSSAPPEPDRELPPQLVQLHADAPGTAVSARDAGTRIVINSVACPDLEERRTADDGEEAERPSARECSDRPAAAPARIPAVEKNAPSANGTSAAPTRIASEKIQGDIPADRLLRDALPLWTNVVSSIYHRQGRGEWSEQEYRRLYEGLLTACSRGEAGSAERRILFRRLREILQPWVSLDSLERTEPDLLGSLLAQSRQAEHNLGVRRPLRRMSRWLRILAAPVLIFWLLFQGGAAGWRLLSAGPGGVNGLNLSSMLHSLQLDTLPGQACVLLPLLVLMAVLLVRK